MNKTTTVDSPPNPISRRLRPMITRAHRAELQAERDRRRRQLAVDFAERLRLAREFGSPSENDEYLQIKEEEAVLAAGIAHITSMLDSARVLDEGEARAGIAVIGSTVKVRFADTGQTRDFQLVSGHQALAPDVASAGSPIGQALMGQAAGAVVEIALPRGKRRSLEVLSVTERT